MATTRAPRSGSMQFWHRARARRMYPKVRFTNTSNTKDTKPVEFAGYKVGMSHAIFLDSGKNSMTKGEEIIMPVTIVECPPIKIASVRFYKREDTKWRVIGEVLNHKVDKELRRKIQLPKSNSDPIKKMDELCKNADDIKISIYTQPKLTGIGKKKPELFEISLSGTKDSKLSYAKEHLDKEIAVKDVFKEGQQIDTHSITKGKGFQGPVKRFGVSIRSHKSEKTKRGPGTLSGWEGHAHFMYRIAHAGQMGLHQRISYNNWLLKIIDDPKKVNPSGGFIRFGIARNTCLIFKGSIGGAKKRLIRLVEAIRPNHLIPADAPEMKKLSLESQQGR